LSEDYPATIKALRGYAVRLDNGAVVSFGDLVDSLETPVRNDAVAALAKASEPAPALMPARSADERDDPDLDKVTAAIAEVEQQLDQVEDEDRLGQLEDRLAELETRETELAARTAAINSALERNDLKALASLVGVEQEEDDE
jgi:septal ring factor EnvC (AmiA/AmiB activator)